MLVIIRVFLALMCGLAINLILIERDEAFKRAVCKQCIELCQSAMNCRMKCRSATMSVMSLSVTFDDVEVSGADESDSGWHWGCARYTIKIAPWALITRGIIGLVIDLKNVNVYSNVAADGSCAIAPHLAGLACLSAPDSFRLCSLNLHPVHINLAGAASPVDIDLDCTLSARERGPSWHLTFECSNARCSYTKNTLFDNFSANLQARVTYSGSAASCSSPTVSLSMSGKGVVPGLADGNSVRANNADPGPANLGAPCQGNAAEQCSCTLSYEDGVAQARVWHEGGKADIKDLEIRTTPAGVLIKGTARVPVAYLLRVLRSPSTVVNGEGTCTASGRFLINNGIHEGAGSLVVDNLGSAGVEYAHRGTATFVKDGTMWRGRVKATRGGVRARGLWRWDTERSRGLCVVFNDTAVAIDTLSAVVNHAVVQRGCVRCTCAFNERGALRSSYRAKLDYNDAAGTPRCHTLRGICRAAANAFVACGHAGLVTYSCAGLVEPHLRVTRADVGLRKESIGEDKERVSQESTVSIKKVMSMRAKDPLCLRWKATVDGGALAPFISCLTGLPVEGHGIFDVYGCMRNGKHHIKTVLKDGALRLGATYACITGLDALGTFDPQGRNVVVDDAHINFYEGKLSCRHASAFFDDTWRPTFVTIPVVADGFLVNVKRDIFATVAGNVRLSMDTTRVPHLAGLIMLDHAQLSDNVFSGALYEAIARQAGPGTGTNGFDATYDMTFVTRKPIHIKTDFLSGEARAHITLKGTVKDPHLSGSVTLSSGALMFPYKPLMITKANVDLDPTHLEDPRIEIVAKNRIKKYAITLHVVGTLHNHHIVLSSAPSLNSENIMSLLLVGSHEQSLASVVPALAMGTIKELIFDRHHTHVWEKYCQNLLPSLKNVHFVPSFSDQTGRGGLRATLEVDINDRWHAAVQKNFGLSEDTRFEVEYMMSDDISLKACRDEHRDISGEVGLRWRF